MLRSVIYAIVLTALVNPGAVHAQTPLEGARIAALGGAGGALDTEFWGRRNPAAWASQARTAIGVTAAQLYGMPELRAAGLTALFPIRHHIVAVGATTFGFDLYRHQTFDVGYARSVGVGTFRRLAFGFRFRTEAAAFEGYGAIRGYGLTGGIQVQLTPLIRLGAALHNVGTPDHLRLATSSQPLSIGMVFRSPGFLLAADVQKDTRSPTRLAAGVEIPLVHAFLVRGGVASDPQSVALGIGLRISPLSIDTAATIHHALGRSVSLSATITL